MANHVLIFAVVILRLLVFCADVIAESDEKHDQICQNTPLTVVIAPDTAGLMHDAKVFETNFGTTIFSYKESPPEQSSMSSSSSCSSSSSGAVWIFLELTPNAAPDYAHPAWRERTTAAPTKAQAPRVWVMANTDQFSEKIFLQPHLELILCKTRQCVEFIQEMRTRIGLDPQSFPIAYIGFTSFSPIAITQQQSSSSSSSSSHTTTDSSSSTTITASNDGFLHIAGQSPLKGTVPLLQAWLQHPAWPPVTITSYNNMALDIVLGNFQKQGGTLPPNVNCINRKLDKEELIQLMTSHGTHLCPSGMEGFGHYINEARSLGALVVTTDFPAMNEFFPSGGGILVKPVSFIPWTNGLMYANVDASSMTQAIETVLQMSESERVDMGTMALEGFQQDQKAFQGRIQKLRCLVDDDDTIMAEGGPLWQRARNCGIEFE